MTPTEPLVEAELGLWTERVRNAVFHARAHCCSHGYALAVHGSLRRDIDVVAVPWIEKVTEADALAQSLFRYLVECEIVQGWGTCNGIAVQKPRGRLAYSLLLCGHPFTYLDLSVMP